MLNLVVFRGFFSPNHVGNTVAGFIVKTDECKDSKWNCSCIHLVHIPMAQVPVFSFVHRHRRHHKEGDAKGCFEMDRKNYLGMGTPAADMRSETSTSINARK